MRKTYNSKIKFKIALEAMRGDLTIAQIVSKYGVSESLVHKWKKQLLETGDSIFTDKRSIKEVDNSNIEKLHAKIGQLTLERDFLENALSTYPGKSAKKW
jgi:transposase